MSPWTFLYNYRVLKDKMLKMLEAESSLKIYTYVNIKEDVKT